nr:MAG TPA: hypothetical protein [Caudoviricetes sp.]
MLRSGEDRRGWQHRHERRHLRQEGRGTAARHAAAGLCLPGSRAPLPAHVAPAGLRPAARAEAQPRRAYPLGTHHVHFGGGSDRLNRRYMPLGVKSRRGSECRLSARGRP